MMNRKKTLDQREQELLKREQALEEREQAVGAREREMKMGPISQAVQNKKEQWYEKINLTVHQVDVIIWITSGLLVVVLILIILEATGIFKL